MNTNIFIISVILMNLLSLTGFYFLLKKSKGFYYLFYSLLMIFSTWVIAESFNQINIYFRNNNILIELGHGSPLLIGLWFISLLLSLIIIIVVAVRKGNGNSKKDKK